MPYRSLIVSVDSWHYLRVKTSIYIQNKSTKAASTVKGHKPENDLFYLIFLSNCNGKFKEAQQCHEEHKSKSRIDGKDLFLILMVGTIDQVNDNKNIHKMLLLRFEMTLHHSKASFWAA